MKTQHTPGPWSVKDKLVNCSHYVCCEQNIPVAVIPNIMTATEDGKRIDGVPLANAHLIAAAPDLLEALQKISELCEGCSDGCAELGAVADAAIAKATGRSNID